LPVWIHPDERMDPTIDHTQLNTFAHRLVAYINASNATTRKGGRGPIMAVEVGIDLAGVAAAMRTAAAKDGATYVCTADGTVIAGSNWFPEATAMYDPAEGLVVYPQLWDLGFPWMEAISPKMVAGRRQAEAWSGSDIVVARPLAVGDQTGASYRTGLADLRIVSMAPPLARSNLPAGGRCVILGGLPVFSCLTVLCEVLIACISAGVVGPSLWDDVLQAGVSEADNAHHNPAAFGPQAFGNFLWQQIALSLVMVRLYFAWLANSLHKWQANLTFAILPELPTPASIADYDSDSARPQVNRPVLAWTAEAMDAGARYEKDFLARRRCRRLGLFVTLAAFVLMLVASAIIVLHSHEAGTRASSSSCRTAARGIDFCVRGEYLGLFEYLPSVGECCASCEASPGCQAWTFSVESSKRGRCSKMSFLDSPCRENPGHFVCRCRTNSDKFGGFKSLPGDVVSSGG